MSGLLTIGSAALELSPRRRERLERTSELSVRVNGHASNVAVAATRNGTPATWLSKLPDSALGRRVVTELGGLGVDPEVVWSETGRQGLVFREPGQAPRAGQRIVDHEGAAARSLESDELPGEAISAATMVYVDGTVATDSALAETLETVLGAAANADVRTVVGLTTPGIDTVPTALLELADVLVATPAAAETAIEAAGDSPATSTRGGNVADSKTARSPSPDGGNAHSTARSPEETIHTLTSRWSLETALLTRTDHPTVAWHDTTVYERIAPETALVDDAGTHDAIAGGFLSRRLAGDSIETALSAGVATGALVRTLPGPLATLTRTEIETTMKHVEKPRSTG